MTNRQPQTFEEAYAEPRERRQQAALHEAAHVIAAHAFDVPVERVALLAVDGGDSQIALRNLDPERALVIRVAGGAAEAIAGYPDPWVGTSAPGDRGDAHDAVRVAEAAGMRAGPAIRQAVSRAGLLLADWWEPTVELANILLERKFLAGRRVREAVEDAIAQAPRGRALGDGMAAARAIASWDEFVGWPSAELRRMGIARLAARVVR